MRREIDDRDRRLTRRRQILLSTGSLSALATTIYSGLADNPRKEVLVPLGAISGGALLSALPSLGTDERADALREQIGSIRAKEATVVAALETLEGGMLKVALLMNAAVDTTRSREERKRFGDTRDSAYVEIAPFEDRLRTALSALGAECS